MYMAVATDEGKPLCRLHHQPVMAKTVQSADRTAIGFHGAGGSVAVALDMYPHSNGRTAAAMEQGLDEEGERGRQGEGEPDMMQNASPAHRCGHRPILTRPAIPASVVLRASVVKPAPARSIPITPSRDIHSRAAMRAAWRAPRRDEPCPGARGWSLPDGCRG